MSNKNKLPSVEQIVTVALYIRVSTEEQAKHGYSLEAQEARLLDYCKQKGYKVQDCYIDAGKTARSKLTARKEMLRLLENAKSKKFDRIVFWKLDRWFRNISDYYKVQAILDECSIDWECTDEEYNTTTSSGRLYLNIRLSIAQNESDQTGDRIRFNFENMVKQKRPIQGSHCMPLGYVVAGDKKNKKVVKDPEKKHIVEDMFRHFDTCKSIRATLLYINNKYNLKILYDSMHAYLGNQLYAGVYRGVIDYCEPYISREQFEKNLNNVKRNYKEGKRHDYIFSGLLRCSQCHYRLSGFTHRSTKPKYQKVYLNPAYRCHNAYNSQLCNNKSPILESHLERYLLANLSEAFANYLIEIQDVKSNEENERNANHAAIGKKLDRLNELYINGHISREKYEQDYQLFTKQLNEIISKKNKKLSTDKYKELLNGDIISIYHLLDNRSKRSFWAEFIDYIERDKDLNYIIHFL